MDSSIEIIVGLSIVFGTAVVIVSVLALALNTKFFDYVGKAIQQWFHPAIALIVLSLGFIGWQVHRYISIVEKNYQQTIQAYDKCANN